MAGADLRAALVASAFRGALPPVDLRAVCLVRAMLLSVEECGGPEHRLRARRERIKRFQGLVTESHGQNLAVTVLRVPRRQRTGNRCRRSSRTKESLNFACKELLFDLTRSSLLDSAELSRSTLRSTADWKLLEIQTCPSRPYLFFFFFTLVQVLEGP